MKTTLLLLLIIMPTVLMGQSTQYVKYAKNQWYRTGYIMHFDSIKEEGLIRRHGYKSITFINKEGIKSKYVPNDILSFYRFQTHFISDRKEFYQIIIYNERIGYFKQFVEKNFHVPEIGGGYRSATITKVKYCLVKPGDSDFTCFRDKDIKDVSLRFFLDCDLLVPILAKPELDYNDLLQLVKEYSTLCAE